MTKYSSVSNIHRNHHHDIGYCCILFCLLYA